MRGRGIITRKTNWKNPNVESNEEIYPPRASQGIEITVTILISGQQYYLSCLLGKNDMKEETDANYAG